MSLATRLEQAIRERDALSGQYTERAAKKWPHIIGEIRTLFEENESAILAALKFQEAVERHSIRLIKLQNGSWHAYSVEQDKLGHSNGTTPAAAVASLVAELEKK